MAENKIETIMKWNWFLELYQNKSNKSCQPGQCVFVFRGDYLSELSMFASV